MKRPSRKEIATGTAFMVVEPHAAYGLRAGDKVTIKSDDWSDCPNFWLPDHAKAKSLYLQFSWLAPWTEQSHVDDVYEGLSEGQRTHMLNKLAKNGYDNRTQTTRNRHDGLRQAKLSPPAKTYALGDRVELLGPKGLKSTYIVSAGGDWKSVALINLSTGMTRNGRLEVRDTSAITVAEFANLS